MSSYVLVLKPGSYVYRIWEHFPVKFMTNIYFFNWTNPKDVYNTSVKPKFQEMGPYKYWVDLRKENVVWNDNGTITYGGARTYFYDDQDKENCNLQDNITSLNVLAVAAANSAKSWNYFTKRLLSATMSGLTPVLESTHTVDELSFKGYKDPYLDIGKTVSFLSGIRMPPWSKFAWFYGRNDSSAQDGVLNAGTGVGTTFGKIYQWNYNSKNPFYQGRCSNLNASDGDRFDPDEISDSLNFFAPIFCHTFTLRYVEENYDYGILAKKYVFDEYALDNGTINPENICSCAGDCVPSGVFNMSSCRYDTPVFGSLPHFYRGDSYYIDSVEGMRPDKDKHEMYAIVEPYTGVFLELVPKMQVNMLLQPIAGLTLFENAPKVFVPILWFEIKIIASDETLLLLKLALLAPTVSSVVGAVLISISLFIIFCIIRKAKQKTRYQRVTGTKKI